MLVIVAYDIKDDSKRREISKLLEEFGFRIQRSVFECLIEKSERRELENELRDFPLVEGEGLVVYTVSSNEHLEKWSRKITAEDFDIL